MTTAVRATSTHEHPPGAQISPDRRGRRAAHPVRLAAADALVLLVGILLATCCGLLAGRAVTRRAPGKARP